MKKHTNKYWKIISILQPWIYSALVVFIAYDIYHLRELKASVEVLNNAMEHAIIEIQSQENENSGTNIPDFNANHPNIITALNSLEKKTAALSRHRPPVDITYVTVTAYTPSVEECDDNPEHTAIMTKPTPGTIAVSRDLLEAGWTFGKRVWIKNHGVFVINDLMNTRHSKQIDIVMFDKKQAVRFGKRESIAVLIQQT